MTDKITLLLLLCLLVVLFFLFLILCYKRVFLEKYFSVLYFLIWSTVTMFEIINSAFAAELYLIFSIFITIAMACTISIAYFLKKYLKTLFSSLIELSFGERCTSQIVIFKDAIGTLISKGYIVYVYDTEKIFTYHSIDDITLGRHRRIALKLDRMERKNKTEDGSLY